MESCGEPLKIHISPQCKEKLDRLGGYLTEERGVVSMKGKGEVITYWLTGTETLDPSHYLFSRIIAQSHAGTTDGAIEKRNVDFKDLPPPLFCRPRKSPKYISDSKQPSISCITNFGASDNRSILCESRRQSNAAWATRDLHETHSLHGSLTGHFRDSSPFITRHRRLDHTPLYINNNESEALDGGEENRKDGMNGSSDESNRQVVRVAPMVRPRNVLNSINSSSEEIGEKNQFSNNQQRLTSMIFQQLSDRTN